MKISAAFAALLASSSQVAAFAPTRLAPARYSTSVRATAAQKDFFGITEPTLSMIM